MKMNDLATPGEERSLYEVRKAIYPRAVRGWFAAWRWAAVWATQLVFYGGAWLTWNDRQAILFDIVHRKFYIFGLVFWPQDVIYLARPADPRGARALPLHRGGRAAVVRLRLPADRLHRDLPVDRAQDRRRPQRADSPRPVRFFIGKGFPERRKARGLDCAFAVDRVHVRRLRHADPRALGRGDDPLDRAVGDLLDPLLRLRHLRQRRLDARAGVQVHVPLRALPERDVRQGHADHHL